MEQIIRIFTRKKTIKTKEGEEKTFCEYSYNKNGEQWFQVKFKKEVDKKPEDTGYYLVKVIREKLSIQKLKPQEKFTPNPILWVGEVISFERDSEYEAELEIKRIEEINALFDDENE